MVFKPFPCSLADVRGVDAEFNHDIAFASGGGNVTAQFAVPKPEEDGELGRLLRPAQLTEWWVDGYMMGVCTALRLIPPADWVEVLLQFIMDDIGDRGKIQRLLDLFVMRYNAAAERLHTPIGVWLCCTKPLMAKLPLSPDTLILQPRSRVCRVR